MRCEAQRRDPREDEQPPISECIPRPMTPEEWVKYGPKSDKPRRSFLMLKQSDVLRSLRNRGLR